MHGLSLELLELGERGGEREEDRDSAPILVRFAGYFLTASALNTDGGI